jgi:hypothetical protein
LSKSCDCQSVRCDTFWAGWFPIVRLATISEKGPYKWVVQAGRPNFLLSHRNGHSVRSLPRNLQQPFPFLLCSLMN